VVNSTSRATGREPSRTGRAGVKEKYARTYPRNAAEGVNSRYTTRTGRASRAAGADRIAEVPFFLFMGERASYVDCRRDADSRRRSPTCELYPLPSPPCASPSLPRTELAPMRPDRRTRSSRRSGQRSIVGVAGTPTGFSKCTLRRLRTSTSRRSTASTDTRLWPATIAHCQERSRSRTTR